MIEIKQYGIACIETNKKINGWKITKEKIEMLHSLVFNHPHIVNSHLTNDHVNIKYHTAGELIKSKKLLIKIPI